MTKAIKIILLFITSILLSYATILLPETNGITVGIFENRQTDTTEFIREIYASGFPIKFYIPAGKDYGNNLLGEAFLFNTLILFVCVVVMYVFIKRFKIK